MPRALHGLTAALILALAVGLAAAPARADEETPLFGWNSEEFSLFPLIYIGHGGFSIPGMRLTEDSFSIPFIHYESEPEKRFDLTPVYHYAESGDGFALGPRREQYNEGIQGVANWSFDLLTLTTNTRPYLGDDHAEYDRYRDTGHSKIVVPGSEADQDEEVSLERKLEPAPPATADSGTPAE
jgi:hypothetical protein